MQTISRGRSSRNHQDWYHATAPQWQGFSVAAVYYALTLQCFCQIFG